MAYYIEYLKNKRTCKVYFEKEYYKIDKEKDCVVVGKKVKEGDNTIVKITTIPTKDVLQIKQTSGVKNKPFIRNSLTGY